jgi:alkylhydroperoxidase family enzyme
MFVRAIRNLLHRLIRRTEVVLGVENDALHFIADTSLKAFLDLALFTKLASHREVLPSEAFHLARIVATESVDCGTCVQFCVNVALRSGMRPDWITATLEHRPDGLPPELREVYDFTGHLLRRTYEEHALRESIRRRYGDAGLLDLAYAIASAQVMPLTKKALGFAESCAKVEVRVKGERWPTGTARLSSFAA